MGRRGGDDGFAPHVLEIGTVHGGGKTDESTMHSNNRECSIKEGLPCEERKSGDVKYGGREKERENGARREIEDGRVYRVCLHTHAGDYLTF